MLNSSIKRQALFYDENFPLVPWPQLLKRYGFNCLYKPREVFWKKALERLSMKKRDNVLEVGCGQGLFLARLNKHYGIKGTGIDVSRASIEYANKHYKKVDLSFKLSSGGEIPFKSNSFDFVVTFDVLEHIENQKEAVEEMIRVLKPGGKLLIYTLNKDDKYTLDWLREKMGADIYSRALHKRELFVDTKWLKKIVENKKAKMVYFELFDAFFTLFFDEVIMALIAILRASKLNSSLIGAFFLGVSSFASFLLYPIINLIDQLWYRNGNSLSFIIIARKFK